MNKFARDIRPDDTFKVAGSTYRAHTVFTEDGLTAITAEILGDEPTWTRFVVRSLTSYPMV